MIKTEAPRGKNRHLMHLEENFLGRKAEAKRRHVRRGRRENKEGLHPGDGLKGSR